MNRYQSGQPGSQSQESHGDFSLKRARSIYLLPNVLTTAALFCGFFAIIQSINNHFEVASISIFVGMLLDLLDGRVARLTQTQSGFGEQYDSLSDMVSFGLAPALIMYEWSLWSLGKLGWLAAFIYVVSAALRLARFNSSDELVDKRFFQGLPSPAAAGLMAGFVWIMIDLQDLDLIDASGINFAWIVFCLSIYSGISMVSNVKFYSFKEINFRKRVPFVFVFGFVLCFSLISFNPPVFLFFVFLLYGVSGYFFWFLSRLKCRFLKNPQKRIPLADDCIAKDNDSSTPEKKI